MYAKMVYYKGNICSTAFSATITITLTIKPTSTESEFSSDIKDNIISQRDIMNRANSYAKNPYTFSCFDASKHSSKQSTFSANRTRLTVLKTKKNPAQMIKD
jgi:hypothetical protein